MKMILVRMVFSHSFRFLAGLSIVVSILSGCDPVPRRTLSLEEKKADLLWVYSQFGQNYAPLRYKEQRFGFDVEALKADYLSRAEKTQTNEEFYELLMSFISEFKDAHTSGSLTQSSLPGRVQVAYLGFSGVREKDHLLIRSILPTIQEGSEYPLKVGDVVLKVDGVPVADKARELFKFRDLGREESNLTFHMNRLFTRISTLNLLPTSKDIELEVRRDSETFRVVLPWVVKDIVQFQAEQSQAKEEQEKTEGKSTVPTGRYAVLSEDQKKLFTLSLMGFNGRMEFPLELIARISRQTRKTVADGFRLVDAVAGWMMEGNIEGTTPEERMKEARNIPAHAVFLGVAKTYPAYVARHEVNGKSALVGVILVDTFSPGDTDAALSEFKGTLKAMQELGVENLILDLINNGGGSLQLGMQMAQALSSTRIQDPTIQFRLSDSWMDSFESDSVRGTSNSGREINRRVLAEMKTDLSSGRWLSRSYPIEVLMPFAIKPNREIKRPFKTAVLINEMCASMCDIFSAVLQDNRMATIVGSNSMGAGGNVVNYQQAPNSHLDLRQTESLIFRKDGSAIENNGTAPDVSVKVVDHTLSKYEPVYTQAIQELFKL